MNKEYITDYKARLEKGLAEFMELPISERSTEAVKSIYECLTVITVFTFSDNKNTAKLEDKTNDARQSKDKKGSPNAVPKPR